MNLETDQIIYDVIIAGGGSSGVLSAARLHSLNPDLSILILEKEPFLGGRLRSSDQQTNKWSYGLNSISEPLFQLWNQTLKSNPESPDLPDFIYNRQSRFAVISGGTIDELPVAQVFSKKTAKVIGGTAAAREWQSLEPLFNQENNSSEKEKDQPFAHAVKLPRKSPSAVVLEHLATVVGIPDIWSTSRDCLAERSKSFASQRYEGEWEDSLQTLASHFKKTNKVRLLLDTRIVQAQYQEGLWLLETNQGQQRSKKLIIAHSPWDALTWLPKSFWPPSLLAMTVKSKPVSIVVLSEVIKNPDVDLPDVILILSESVQVMTDKKKNTICFQATIDYEISLQAPEVVKAVKRLRRARKKLMAMYPALQLEGDHIALLPVGWAQSTDIADRRWLKKIETSEIATEKLGFCGDAYGASFNGDENIVNSIITTCDSILEKPRRSEYGKE